MASSSQETVILSDNPSASDIVAIPTSQPPTLSASIPTNNNNPTITIPISNTYDLFGSDDDDDDNYALIGSSSTSAILQPATTLPPPSSVSLSRRQPSIPSVVDRFANPSRDTIHPTFTNFVQSRKYALSFQRDLSTGRELNPKHACSLLLRKFTSWWLDNDDAEAAVLSLFDAAGHEPLFAIVPHTIFAAASTSNPQRAAHFTNFWQTHASISLLSVSLAPTSTESNICLRFDVLCSHRAPTSFLPSCDIPLTLLPPFIFLSPEGISHFTYLYQPLPGRTLPSSTPVQDPSKRPLLPTPSDNNPPKEARLSSTEALDRLLEDPKLTASIICDMAKRLAPHMENAPPPIDVSAVLQTISQAQVQLSAATAQNSAHIQLLMESAAADRKAAMDAASAERTRLANEAATDRNTTARFLRDAAVREAAARATERADEAAHRENERTAAAIDARTAAVAAARYNSGVTSSNDFRVPNPPPLPPTAPTHLSAHAARDREAVLPITGIFDSPDRLRRSLTLDITPSGTAVTTHIYSLTHTPSSVFRAATRDLGNPSIPVTPSADNCRHILLLEFDQVSIGLFRPVTTATCATVTHIIDCLHWLAVYTLYVFGTALTAAITSLSHSVLAINRTHPILQPSHFLQLIDTRLFSLRSLGLRLPTDPLDPALDGTKPDTLPLRTLQIAQALSLTTSSPDFNLLINRLLMNAATLSLSPPATPRTPPAPRVPRIPPVPSQRRPPIDWTTCPIAAPADRPCFNWVKKCKGCEGSTCAQTPRTRPHKYAATTDQPTRTAYRAWVLVVSPP